MNKLFTSTALALLLGTSLPTSAGLYSDDLSRCLVDSASQRDKDVLVKWMFTSISLHPVVAGMSNLSDADHDASNRDAANMFVRLMSEDCLEEARKAVKYEGPLAIQQGFELFGQVAGQELFAHPNVATALAGLERHMDGDKLAKALGLPAQ
ncbi:hypothetical protein [Marinobacter sp. SS21]|uniref:hypothetical protein n=1 Tax=Marinobacter sp. SS21 TaxID=2979460 RepID=UPI00232DA64D|nr:hypothetical protein [Marinobacter sp. SS21]MDC0661178.1 hypothetical protein [Marinobacter sp. SS21]